MAQRTVTVLTDDVHGGDAPASQSITFALDRVGHVIDLDDDNAARLRGDLATRTGHGRKQRGATAGRARARVAGSPAAGSGVDTAAVRAWAREHDHQVSDRGSVKADVLQAYDAAQSRGQAGARRRGAPRARSCRLREPGPGRRRGPAPGGARAVRQWVLGMVASDRRWERARGSA